MIEDRYLGDGVYASFDGYNIWLDTRGQSERDRIALEPKVLSALDKYRFDIFLAIEKAPAPEEG